MIQEHETAAYAQRTRWQRMNAVMFGIQGLILGLGIYLRDWDYGAGVPMMLGWLVSVPVFAAASARLRPEQAFSDEKPTFEQKWVYGIFHGFVHLIGTAVLGSLVYMILGEVLFVRLLP